jgi:hypothetical protein
VFYGTRVALAGKTGPLLSSRFLTGLMMVGGCGDGIVLGRTPHCLSNGSRGACEASAPVIPGWQRDIVDPDPKAKMVKDLVAAFAKAARVSDVPDEAITTDTREPSYMFLAVEWNRSSGIVNLTRSSRPSWPLSLQRGQPYRRAKDFSAPDRRATHGRRIPPLLKLTMPPTRVASKAGTATNSMRKA